MMGGTDTRTAPPRARSVVAEVAGLSKHFGDTAVLDSIDLAIEAGEFVALVGPSGTGKTTLLRILAGLETGTRGSVRVTPTRSVVFQEPRLIPSQRVWRNVVMQPGPSRGNFDRAVAALTEVGMAPFAKAWPKTLSGGEAQRVGLARALFREPRLLLLDEPFGALDAFTRIKAQQLVLDLWHLHQPGVLLVTHDIDEALQLADRVVVLGGGRVKGEVVVGADRPRGPSDELFQHLKREVLRLLADASEAGAKSRETKSQ